MLFQVLTCLLVVSVQGHAIRGLAETLYQFNGFKASITGNGSAPEYTFSTDDVPGRQYRLKFQEVYESKAGARIGSTSISPSSLNWVVANVNASVFWWNATDDKIGHIAFLNQLFDDSLKFDIILDNYVWEASDSDALNLFFKLSNYSGSGESQGPPATTEPTELCFFDSGGSNPGKVCFGIVGTATATTSGGSSSVSVALSYRFDSDEGILVTYTRFQGNLTHDPTFRFDPAEQVGFFARLLAFIAYLFSLLFS